MARSFNDFGRDTSLYHRLRDSVLHMMRGKGQWGSRAAYAFERLAPLREADFPAQLQPGFALIKALHEMSIARYSTATLLVPSTLSPRQRDAFTDALFGLYEAAAHARDQAGL